MSYPVDAEDPATGPLTGPTAEITAETNETSTAATNPKSPTSPTGETRGEQPLESHEVIELQTFSDRQAWIEEKIKVNHLIYALLPLANIILVSGKLAPHRSVCGTGCTARADRRVPGLAFAGEAAPMDGRTRCNREGDRGL